MWPVEVLPLPRQIYVPGLQGGVFGSHPDPNPGRARLWDVHGRPREFPYKCQAGRASRRAEGPSTHLGGVVVHSGEGIVQEHEVALREVGGTGEVQALALATRQVDAAEAGLRGGAAVKGRVWVSAGEGTRKQIEWGVESQPAKGSQPAPLAVDHPPKEGVSALSQPKGDFALSQPRQS